jgi:predicted metal-dependent phosphoesterase TrpH
MVRALNKTKDKKSEDMNNTHRIVFTKPDLPKLTKRYTVVDMHAHTQYSDGFSTVEEIAHRAHELGIGIAITDHNDIRGAVEIHNDTSILSIPGIEITSKEGAHLLLYFYDIESLERFYKREVRPHMGNSVMSSISLKMEEIIERARACKAIIIFPHPYCAAYTGICNPLFSEERLRRLFDMVDGVEVINSQNLKKWNLRSAVLGFNLDKSITGGSDSHRLGHIGNVVSYAFCENNCEAFLDAVKNKQNKVMGKEIDMLRKLTSTSFKLKANFKNYPDIFEKNFKYSYTVINSRSKKLRDDIKRSIHGKIENNRKSRGSSF